MRASTLSLALAAGLAAAASASAQPDGNERPRGDFVAPGLWETTTVMTSPFHSEKTEQRCVKPADVVKFMQPCNHHYDCEYAIREIADGHIVLKGQWVGKKDKQVVEVAGSGAYTRTTLHATAQMHTRLLGLPISGRATTDAHRLSAECPAAVAGQ